MLGTKNASVLPDPVRAAPSTSRPYSSGGMQRACTSVMWLKDKSCMALRVFSERSSDSNVELLIIPSIVTLVLSTSIWESSLLVLSSSSCGSIAPSFNGSLV